MTGSSTFEIRFGAPVFGEGGQRVRTHLGVGQHERTRAEVRPITLRVAGAGVLLQAFGAEHPGAVRTCEVVEER